jgi:N-acetylglutamate synthase-like GNAT family acetyltransferase
MSRPRAEKVSPSEVTVRLATPQDSEAISRVLLEAFITVREYYTDEAFEIVTPKPEEVENRFAEGPMWVAERDGEIVGTVSLAREPEGLYVRSMAVLPGEQGRGIGRLLLDRLHEHAAGEAIDRIFLYTLPFQKGAREMYEKYGYKWVRDTPAEEWYGVPGLEMEKFLSKENAA